MKVKNWIPGALGLLGTALLTGCGNTAAQPSTTVSNPGTIVVGSKNFTESTVLAYMLADLIKAKTHLHVKEELNLGATNITESAIRSGAIDMYVEYSGTLYEDYLHHTKKIPESQVYPLVKKELQTQMGLTLTQPLGFNDGFALVANHRTAQQYHLSTDSELARVSPHLAIGMDPEFRVRQPDGWTNLQKLYGFHFKNVSVFSNGIKYTALQNNEIQVTDGFTTDPQIAAYHLVALSDNKHFFMLYNAVPIVRQATLKQYPQLKHILDLLGGKISTEEMSHLNGLVAIDHQSANTVAEEFLKHIGLIK